jgi:hypothetical protein
VLRSVVQDHNILPTVCYFGGGAEISYFAQSGEVYSWPLPGPITIPYFTAVCICHDPKNAKRLTASESVISDLFEGPDVIKARIVEGFSNKDAAGLPMSKVG